MPQNPQGYPQNPQDYMAQAQQAAQAYQQQAQQQYAQPEYDHYDDDEAPRKPKKGLVQIIGSVVGVAVLGFGAWGIYSNFVAEQALQPGKCVRMTGTQNNADVEEVKCDDASQLSYKVLEVSKAGSKACTDSTGDYIEFTVTKSSRRGGSSKTSYCMMPNLVANACYHTANDPQDEKIVECSSQEAKFKVTKVIDSIAEDQCGEAEKAVSYKLGNRTYCLADPKG